VVEASNRFYTATTSLPDKENRLDRRRVTRALCEVTDPEEKRHIIGDTFVDVAREVMKELGLSAENTFLGQGTLRPDLIESASALASSAADIIKTHHNDSDMVRQWRELGRVIEPLTDFHKDEVTINDCVTYRLVESRLKSALTASATAFLVLTIDYRCVM
jgi:GMP synthase (glutamine-hydrolysing)